MKKITPGSVSESNRGRWHLCLRVSLAEIEFSGWTEHENGEFHGRAADSEMWKFTSWWKHFNLFSNCIISFSGLETSGAFHYPLDKNPSSLAWRSRALHNLTQPAQLPVHSAPSILASLASSLSPLRPCPFAFPYLWVLGKSPEFSSPQLSYSSGGSGLLFICLTPYVV